MIERLKEEQIDAVMEIWLSANIQAHDFINKSYWLSNYQKVKEEFLPVSETYVFVQEGQVRGFISILNGDYIGGLFVAPFCQRQGIGSKLLAYCQRNYPLLMLGVYAQNKQAVNFYTKSGFIKLKKQAEEDTGCTEYLMSWKK
ncbi:N-acetyltransferase [Youxingia wuxianensis]|uniref:N-acetyltransferase n=1 Tax=Youxingia wuxianensis TaxID=2763678 RepID=A0A926IGW8_9FIRM|nr:N-acetyltransferase [Youxingia wuxianensis]MBC8584113.1 N-acetyltransferase [Youxingia wuxianensis]